MRAHSTYANEANNAQVKTSEACLRYTVTTVDDDIGTGRVRRGIRSQVQVSTLQLLRLALSSAAMVRIRT